MRWRLSALLGAVIILVNAAAAQPAPGYGGYYVPAPYTNTTAGQGYQCPHEYGAQGGYGMQGYGMMGGAGAYPGYSPGWFQLVLLLLAAGVLLAYYARSGERAPSGARDILDMRLAKGEITLEEYRRLREVIEE